MYEVREALEIEIPALINIGEQLHSSSAFSHMEYDKVKVAAWLYAAMNQEFDMFLRVIIEKSTGKPIGMMVGQIESSYFGQDTLAVDRLLLVTPEHRGKCINALVWIVNEYHAWAIKKGAKRIFLATSTGIEPEKTEKIYEHLGFRKIGTIHEA